MAVIYDEEFAGLVGEGAAARQRFVAWSEPGASPGATTLLEDLIARGEDSDLQPPAERGAVVILTSGTTGAPKGAAAQAARLAGARRGPVLEDPAAERARRP